MFNVVDDLIDSPSVKLDLTLAYSDLTNRFVALVCLYTFFVCVVVYIFMPSVMSVLALAIM